jgi:hypothetical protein
VEEPLILAHEGENQKCMKRFVMVWCLFLALISCDEATQNIVDESAPVRVSAFTGNCAMDFSSPCYRIQEGAELGSGNWKNVSAPIDGFTYEEGFTYLLIVRIERVPGLTSETPGLKYTLVKVLSKDKV